MVSECPRKNFVLAELLRRIVKGISTMNLDLAAGLAERMGSLSGHHRLQWLAVRTHH
jgi:hypothetical protein